MRHDLERVIFTEPDPGWDDMAYVHKLVGSSYEEYVKYWNIDFTYAFDELIQRL